MGIVLFGAHVELFQLFMAHRDEIVESIQALLNAQKKPVAYLQDSQGLSRHVEDCFFKPAGIQSSLRGQLQEAHWASGFKPRVSPGLHNDLVDPGEMTTRAFGLWQRTHWPGYSGRARYAHTLFNLYMIRHLALLIMRVWDEDASGPTERISQIQSLLDQLWRTTPPGHPVLVRDARWLIPIAQSPTTDELRPYFEVAERIAETLSPQEQLVIHSAAVRMAGGHLRSQLRHVSLQKGVSFAEASLVLTTRRSNALDLALIVQGLVPLLQAYEDALQRGDGPARLGLADAICQGISPDPELFLNRLDLLGPYSMIEHRFITSGTDGRAAYTPMGRRHVRLLGEYTSRIGRLSKALYDDCKQLRPVDGAYSPYGVLYGFSSNLLEHMAFKTLQADAETNFCVEDAFAAGEADKRAWVSGWRKLPHITREVARLFEYPQEFAETIFARIEQALNGLVSDNGSDTAIKAGRLFILPGDDPAIDSRLAGVPQLPAPYIESSDMQIVAAQKTVSFDQAALLHSRSEGEFLLSYKTPAGWVAITKDLLTEVLGAGRDVKITGLPPAAAGMLKLMAPHLVTLPEELS